MKKVLIDENLTPLVASALATTYRKNVKFYHCNDVNLTGIKDPELIETAARLDFNMLVTEDFAQLSNSDEATALAKFGFHWVGVHAIDVPGVMGISQQLSVAIPAVGHVLQCWPDQPTAFVAPKPRSNPVVKSFLLSSLNP